MYHEQNESSTDQWPPHPLCGSSQPSLTWPNLESDQDLQAPGMLEHGSLRPVCPFIRCWFRGQAGEELGNFKTQTIVSYPSRKTLSCWTVSHRNCHIQKAPWKPSQGAWCNDPLALILPVSPSSFPHPTMVCAFGLLSNIVSLKSFEQALLPHGSITHTVLHTPCNTDFRSSFLSIVVIKILGPKAAYGIKGFIWLIFFQVIVH